MRRFLAIALGAALLAASGWVVRIATAGPSGQAAAGQAAGQAAHVHTAAATGGPTDPNAKLIGQLVQARLATAKYATNLQAAKDDGYQIITRMIPDMGWHFLNPKIQGFDVRKPHILVYARKGDAWQLVALEWVFPETPAAPPLDNATFGSFPAACHYTDGTFVPAPSQDRCAKTSPDTGAPFNFWHPPLVTMHVWLWYPNPIGLFSGTNPLMHPFNDS